MGFKTAPMPKLMFSVLKCLVCGPGSREEPGAEIPKAHTFDEADHGKDRKCRSLKGGILRATPRDR